MTTQTKTTKTAPGVPESAALQVQETLAINRLQHLDNALREIQHLKRSVYDLTESRAKVARHAEKLAEALRDCLPTVWGVSETGISAYNKARSALAAYESEAHNV